MNLLPMPFIRTNHAEARRYSAYSVLAIPNPTREYYSTWAAIRQPLRSNIKRLFFAISSWFAHASRCRCRVSILPHFSRLPRGFVQSETACNPLRKRKLQAVVSALMAVYRACVNMQEWRVPVAVAHIDAATDRADKADNQKRGCFLLRRVCNFNLHGAPSCTARFCGPALRTVRSSPPPC